MPTPRRCANARARSTDTPHGAPVSRSRPARIGLPRLIDARSVPVGAKRATRSAGRFMRTSPVNGCDDAALRTISIRSTGPRRMAIVDPLALSRLQHRLARFGRVGLAQLPTPLEPLPRLTAHLNGPRVWVKREDCTGLAFGGNKLRK